MRKWILGLVLALSLGAVTRATDIQPEVLLEHIKFLAADEMKGRGNGTPELEIAADYIARQFEDIGLLPGHSHSYFQPFGLAAGLTVGEQNSLSLRSGVRTVQLGLGKSYYPLAVSPDEIPSEPSVVLRNVPLVFAGYGLSVPALAYDDYAGIDVSGKAVLVFSHEPQEHDSNSRFNGTRPVPQSTLQAKATAARTRGAIALLVVSDPTHRTDDGNYALFGMDPEAESHGIPILRVRREEVQVLIDAWDLDAVARNIDRDLVPRSRLLDATVDYVQQFSLNRRVVRNVIGILPGSDPALAGEAIVVGAHYDHVGLGGRFSVTPERTGEIHNGADDNASGTAAIIEMARAAVRQRARFPRTMIFMAFAGEERGLLGSAHYVANPVVPLSRTVAMLNLDMVGRSNGSVDVSGLEAAPWMEDDLEAAAAAVGGLRIRREGPGAGRSDDWSFITRGIPAINFFTGFHGDYHRPGDDWQKIDVPGTSRVAALALELAARIAARVEQPEFVSPR